MHNHLATTHTLASTVRSSLAIVCTVVTFSFFPLSASAQLTSTLPSNFTSLSTFSSDQLASIESHVAAHASAIGSDDPNAISTHRDLLLEPLLKDLSNISVPFRVQYAQQVVPILKPMLNDDRLDVAINAAIVLGHLATRQSLESLESALTDKRPAVRLTAYNAHAHTFSIIAASSGLPLSDQQAQSAINTLTRAFATETDAAAQEAYVAALSAAAQVPESRLPNLRPSAIQGLATSLGDNMPNVSLRAAYRAATSLFFEITTAERQKNNLPQDVLVDAARFVGDILASVRTTLQTTTPTDDDRRMLAALVDTTERIFFFTQQKLSLPAAETNLSRSISDKRDDSFARAVDKLLGPTGPLARTPFNIDPARYEN